MTSPNINLDGVLPYGVTVVGDGTNRTAQVATPAKRATNDRLSLPGGPVRVSASWSGPEEVRLALAGVGYPVKIPVGGVPFWDGGCRLEERRHRLSGIGQQSAIIRGGSRHYRGVPTPTDLTTGAVV